jgi:hypothetical protein
MINNKLRMAIDQAIKALDENGLTGAKTALETALNQESSDSAIEAQTKNGWKMNLERPVGERVNPKVFGGKTIYNAWMNEKGITVIFRDWTEYIIGPGDYNDIQRVR